MSRLAPATLPDWISDEVLRYIKHTEVGTSIRQLAREAGCHPSTVLRQVRRVESRRDDALIDHALSQLGHFCQSPEEGSEDGFYHSVTQLETAAIEVLGRLCRVGSVLAVAESMEKAVVVREGEAHDDSLAISKTLAAILALLDWITCTRSGRLSRYHITPTGRSVLNRLVAARENRARAQLEQGMVDGPSAFLPQKASGTRERRCRYGLGETPLDMLARLTDKSGTAFLSPDLVKVGKRLREDYELAQIGDHLAQESQYFSGEADCGTLTSIRPSPASEAAKKRAMEALKALGPGLNDIALRCCCHLEGLEAAEQHLGWSARSGKIVLRIALTQLQGHYEDVDKREGRNGDSQMIG